MTMVQQLSQKINSGMTSTFVLYVLLLFGMHSNFAVRATDMTKPKEEKNNDSPNYLKKKRECEKWYSHDATKWNETFADMDSCVHCGIPLANFNSRTQEPYHWGKPHFMPRPHPHPSFYNRAIYWAYYKAPKPTKGRHQKACYFIITDRFTMRQQAFNKVNYETAEKLCKAFKYNYDCQKLNKTHAQCKRYAGHVASLGQSQVHGFGTGGAYVAQFRQWLQEAILSRENLVGSTPELYMRKAYLRFKKPYAASKPFQYVSHLLQGEGAAADTPPIDWSSRWETTHGLSNHDGGAPKMFKWTRYDDIALEVVPTVKTSIYKQHKQNAIKWDPHDSPLLVEETGRLKFQHTGAYGNREYLVARKGYLCSVSLFDPMLHIHAKHRVFQIHSTIGIHQLKNPFYNETHPEVTPDQQPLMSLPSSNHDGYVDDYTINQLRNNSYGDANW